VPLVTHQTASAATGCPAQVNAEQVAQAQAAAGAMTSADLVGVYHRFPVENGYHEVNVFVDDTGQLWWQNQSVQWTLTLDESGLSTGADCPYGELSVAIELLEGPDGQVYGIPEHLIFSGESYDRIWNQNP
jgi:streptogramin lyase